MAEPRKYEPEESLDRLYKTVSQTYDIGDFETFSEKMQNPESRAKFFYKVSERYNLGQFDDFSKKVTLPPSLGQAVRERMRLPGILTEKFPESKGAKTAQKLLNLFGTSQSALASAFDVGGEDLSVTEAISRGTTATDVDVVKKILKSPLRETLSTFPIIGDVRKTLNLLAAAGIIDKKAVKVGDELIVNATLDPANVVGATSLIGLVGKVKNLIKGAKTSKEVTEALKALPAPDQNEIRTLVRTVVEKEPTVRPQPEAIRKEVTTQSPLKALSSPGATGLTRTHPERILQELPGGEGAVPQATPSTPLGFLTREGGAAEQIGGDLLTPAQKKIATDRINKLMKTGKLSRKDAKLLKQGTENGQIKTVDLKEAGFEQKKADLLKSLKESQERAKRTQKRIETESPLTTGQKVRQEIEASQKIGKKAPGGEANTIHTYLRRSDLKIDNEDLARYGFGKNSRENADLFRSVGKKGGVSADEAAQQALADGIIEPPPPDVNLTDHFMQKVRDNAPTIQAKEAEILKKTGGVKTKLPEVKDPNAGFGEESAIQQLTQKIKTGKVTGDEIKAGATPEVEALLRDEFKLAKTDEERVNIAQGIDIVTQAQGKKPGGAALAELTGKKAETPEPKASGINFAKETRTKLRETWQDSQIRVQQLQETPGVKLKGAGLDPLETEIRFHGRLQKRIDDQRQIVDDIDKDTIQLGKKYKVNDSEINEELNRYLIARHAPEYNAQHGAKAAGITDADAADILKDIDSLPYSAEVKQLGKRVQDFNKQTLEILHDNQVIDDALYKKLKGDYKEYVPFNRIMDDVPDEELIDVLTGGKGISVKGSGLKRAKGSEREIDDVLANSMANVLDAIGRAEKNRVGLSTLDFARNNKNLGLFEEIKPTAIGLTFKKDPITGKPIPMTNAKELMQDKNILTVREKGKPVYLKINDPALASALKGTNQEVLGKYMRVAGAITRVITQLATRFNPAFQIPNILRDSQEMASFLVAQKDFGISGALSTSKRIPDSMKDVIDFNFNRNTPGAKLYEQLKNDGGTTGGMAASTRQQEIINMEKLRKTNRSNPRKVAKQITKIFDGYNAIFEDATRLSVYKEALERGLTREQASVLAKESTINFNRKGTHGAQANALFAFANASLQGSAKMLKAMKNPKVLATVTSSVTGAVLMQNYVNDAIDPEWRDKVTPWERNNNLVIVAPWKNEEGDFARFLIPVSWGIKPIKTMADYFVDTAQGVDRGSPAEIATGIAGASLDAYNPLGGSNLRQAITPTVLDIPADIWANEAWHGRTIKPEYPYLRDLPEHKKYFPSLRQTKSGRLAINVTDYLAENGGVRISPQSLKYAIEQMGGGATKFGVQSFNTALSVADPKEGDVNEVPVINRFFKITPQDQIEAWKKSKLLNDSALKKFQEQSDVQELERSVKVRDAFDQYKEAQTDEEKKAIRRDLANQDPKAYKSLINRIKDDRRGIDYYTSQLKELEPEFRAEMVLIELERAENKTGRYKELRRARVIDAATNKILKQKGLDQILGVTP